VEHWEALDPIPRYRNYLHHVGVWNERLDERVKARSERMRTELRSGVVDAPDFDITDIFDTTYADITPDLVEQRQRLLTELAKEA
jgi:pyruvate dehydrogenase E1 component alpha subunit